MPDEQLVPYHREEVLSGHSLDELAKGLANGAIPRGRALKLVGAALLGGMLPTFLLAGTAEARRRRRRGCPPCDASNTDTIPDGACCLTFGMQRQGCLATSQTCGAVCPSLGCICICVARAP